MINFPNVIGNAHDSIVSRKCLKLNEHIRLYMMVVEVERTLIVIQMHCQNTLLIFAIF